MSARFLRKVLQEQESQVQQQQQQQQRGKSAGPESEGGLQVDDGDETDESPDSSIQASRNVFDLLNDDECDPDEGSEPEIADEPLMGNTDDKQPSLVKATITTFPSANHKAKKKNKKKKKENPFSSTINVGKPLDVMLENLSTEDNSTSHQSGGLEGKSANVEVGEGLVKRRTTSILQVDPKFLRAENELRRKFGYKVVNTVLRSHETGTSRQIRGGRRGSHNHRRTILVSPSEHWPRWDGSFSMELLETRDGNHYFKYVHPSSYSQAQRAFEAAKAIHDLNGIASILLHHPYHLDSLITMAEYFQFSGEHQLSEDYIEKCLYALECAWHPIFSTLQGNCQLKYSHESNRPFFSALFAHMKNTDRRGCHRSALEICKLLLSLDSDDRKGAMRCIDYFALRAEEYKWLEQFSEEYISDPSVWLLPNFSYSLAICRFYLEQEASSKDTQMESEKATSTDLLKQALMLHPFILKKLVVKVPLKDRAWTNIIEHRFFRSEETRSPSLDHLVSLYIERSYIIWRLPDLQKLLRNSALQVIEALDNGGNDASDWACVRKEVFASEKNEYGHLLLSDFSDSVPTMPPDNLRDFMVDPTMRELQNQNQVANPPHGARAPRDVANRNALAVLFESMLPWIDYGGRDGGVGEDDQHNGHIQED